MPTVSAGSRVIYSFVEVSIFCHSCGKDSCRGTELFWRLNRVSQHRVTPTESGIFPGLHTVFDVMQGVVPLEWTVILRGCGLSAGSPYI